MKKKIIEEKGSMAVYVTVVLLGFIIVLSAIYMSATSVRKTQLETNIKIKESYEANYGDIDKIYQNQLTKLQSEE